MRNIIYGLVAVLLLSLSSCFKDKGNYDYKQIADVEINGFDVDEEGYSAIAFETTLNIPIEIKTTTPADRMSYIWSVSKTYTSNWDGGAVVVPIDTIGRDKDLNYYVELDPGDYHLYYTVINEDTEIQASFNASLTVGTKFSTGFFVTKEVSGNTDIDAFTRDGVLIGDNVITEKYGEPIPGKLASFGVCFQYSYIIEETNTYAGARTLNIITDRNEVYMYNAEDLNRLRDRESLFFADTPTDKPYHLRMGMFGVLYISGGGGYFSYQNWPGVKGTGMFGLPILLDTKGYEPNRNMYNMAYDAYMVDELNGRILAIDYNGDIKTFGDKVGNEIPAHGYTPNNFRDKLLFMTGCKVGGSKIYMLCESKDSPGTKLLYTLDAPGFAYSSNPIESVVEIPSSMKFANATMYCGNETNAQMIYFVHGNKLYGYIPATGEEKELSPQGLTAGEEITYVGYRFYANTPKPFTYLVIATHSNGKYKLNMYTLTGGEPRAAAEVTLQGEGKVTGIHFLTNNMIADDAANYSGVF